MNKKKEFNRKLIERLGLCLNDSTKIDVGKLPSNLHFIVEEVLSKSVTGLSSEALTLFVLTRVAQILCNERCTINAKLIKGNSTVFPNLYSIVFAPSGSGKDYVSNLLRNDLLGKVIYDYTERNLKWNENRLDELRREARGKFPSEVSEQNRYVKENIPRKPILETSNGTPQALYVYRELMEEMQYGSLLFVNSEFADYFIHESQENKDFLDLVKEAYEGDTNARILKGEKSAKAVRGVPMNMLVHTSLFGAIKSRWKWEILFNRGFGRRAFVCLQEGTVIDHEVEDLDTYLDSLLEGNIDLESKLYNGSLLFDALYASVREFPIHYVLNTSADKLLMTYKLYTDQLLLGVTDENLRVGLLGRHWKALKLSCLIGAFEHPEVNEITSEDLKVAIYLTETFANHYINLVNSYQKGDETKLLELFEGRIGEWLTTMDIRSANLVHKNKFSAWFDENLSYLKEGLVDTEYDLLEEDFHKNGKRYCLKKLNHQSKLTVSVLEGVNPLIWNTSTMGYKPIEADLEGLIKVVTTCPYVPMPLSNGRREDKSVDFGNNLVVLDVDEAWSYDDAKDFLIKNNIESLIVTTKSHQKSKAGDIADRFRILIPTRFPFYGDKNKWESTMESLYDFFLGKPDKACKNPSRHYLPSPSDARYDIIKGDRLDLRAFYPKSKPIKVEQKSGLYWIDTWADAYFQKNFVKGNRDNTVHAIWKRLSNENFDSERIFEKLEILNSSSLEALSDNELKKFRYRKR